MKEAENKAPEAAEKRDERREYARPELQKHGKVETLTQITSISGSQPLQFG